MSFIPFSNSTHWFHHQAWTFTFNTPETIRMFKAGNPDYYMLMTKFDYYPTNNIKSKVCYLPFKFQDKAVNIIFSS